MTTTQGIAVLLMLTVAACGDDDSRAPVDAGRGDGPWTRADYVATYDENGDGRVDGTEGPLCDPAECTVFCPDSPRIPSCVDPLRFAPLDGAYVPTCDFKPSGMDCGTPVMCGGGATTRPARCLLPWNDPRVIR